MDRVQALLARLVRRPRLFQELLGAIIEAPEPLFALGKQVEERTKKQPAEYKPENQKGDNQNSEGPPVRRNMHTRVSPGVTPTENSSRIGFIGQEFSAPRRGVSCTDIFVCGLNRGLWDGREDQAG